MRNIWLLLKYYCIGGIGNFRRKNTRTKAVVGFTIISLFYLLSFVLFLLTMLTMAKDLSTVNLQANVIALGLIISIFLSVIFALQRVTGGQKANDTEMLLSMPFKKIEIMVAKALSRLVVNLLVVFMFFLPSMIAYLVYTPFSLTALLGCLVVMLLIPLMAVGLSYLVDYLVTVCFSNSKFGNIAKAFSTLIILIGAVAIYEFFIYNIGSQFIVDAINWLVTFNPIVMLPLIIGVLALFIFGNWLKALLLNRETRSTHAKSIEISNKLISPFRAILKNESNRYFNSPTMMLNTLIGPLGMICLTIWLAVDHGTTLTTMICASFGISVNTGYLLVAILFAALTILTYPAAFSISLEGKQLWILRSMPIPAHTILSAKVLFNILLISPITLTCGLILQIVLKLSIMNFIALMLIPVLANVLISYSGVLINLCFPKLEFESEAAVIKQSMSSLIMMLGGMVLITILLVITIGLASYLSAIYLIIIIIGILAIAVGIVAVLTYTIGQRMFNRL